MSGESEAADAAPGLDLRLCIIAALVGLTAGAVGALFRAALDSIAQIREGDVDHLHAIWPESGLAVVVASFAVLGAAAGWLTFGYAPEASGSGIPHVELTLRYGGRLRWVRLLVVKFVAGLCALAAGMSLGREGPTVQMGAAGAEALAQLFALPDRARRALLAAGAGAGLTAAFNAPIGGFLFILEELRRNLGVVTYATGLIATVTADLVIRITLGAAPILGADDLPAPALTSLPWFVVLGVVAAFTGVCFNRSLLFTLDAFAYWRQGPRWLHTAAAGIVAALVVWWFADAAGGGELVAARFIHTGFAGADPLRYLGLLLTLKFLLTLVSYGSGAPGGLFAPLLLIGAALGGFFGHALGLTALTVPSPPCFALSGMVGVFTASVRVPITGIVLIMEMTGGGRQLLPFAVTATVSYLVASGLRSQPIYDALVERSPQGQSKAEV